MAASDIDPMSPTARIHAYLATRGLQPTAQNVRTFLQGQASGNLGSNTLEDFTTQAPPSVGTPSVGGPRRQGRNVAGAIEGGGQKGNYGGVVDEGRWDTGPVGATTPMDRRSDTSAQPQTSDSSLDLSNLGALIATGAATGAGAYLGGRGRGTSTAEFVGNSDIGPTGRMTDVNADAIGGPGDRYGVLPSPDAGVATPTAASPMESAMMRAIEPSVSVPQPGGSVVGNVPPYVSDPYSIIRQSQGLPPGVTPNQAVVAGGGPLDVDPAASRVGVPDMPSLPGARTAARTANPYIESIIGAGRKLNPASLLGRR